MNQFNAINGEDSTNPPIECNIQPPELHFKPFTCPPKTSPVISAIMGVLNHHAVDNGDVNVYTSDYPLESNSEYVTDLYKTPIKSIYDDEMDQIF